MLGPGPKVDEPHAKPILSWESDEIMDTMIPRHEKHYKPIAVHI